MNTFEEYTMNDDFSSKYRIDEIATMTSVGYFTTFKKNGKQELPKFKVFVCDDEFAIPHMHIWDDETNGKNTHTHTHTHLCLFE